MSDKKILKLKAEVRELNDKSLKEGRNAGKVPGIVYGDKKKNENIWVDKLVFSKMFSEAGENTIVELEIGDKKENVLIYDYQIDPLSDEFTHADFLRVDMNKKIEADVPLVYTGEAPAVKELGGTLIKSLDSIAVKCLPGNIPSEFEIDLSKIVDFDSYFTVEDLQKNVSEDVEILVNEEVIIASATPPRSEEELAQLDEKVEEDVSQVEGAEEKEEEKGEGDENKKEESK